MEAGERKKSVSEQMAEKGIDVNMMQNGVHVGEILDIEATDEQIAKVLFKIDRM